MIKILLLFKFNKEDEKNIKGRSFCVSHWHYETSTTSANNKTRRIR